jgi:hypothetical protein
MVGSSYQLKTKSVRYFSLAHLFEKINMKRCAIIDKKRAMASNVIGLPITNFLRKLLVGKCPNPSKPDQRSGWVLS